MKGILCALALLALLSIGSTAQTFRGGISGAAIDQSGAVMAQIPVTATNQDTGLKYQAISSSAGEFVFQDLPLGSYTVTASAPGFKRVEIKGVVVSAGKIYNLPIRLAVASESSTVEVSASAISLDTTSVAQNTVFASKAVQEMPNNGRDFTKMISMSPSFTGYEGGGSTNGMRPTSVNWQIEGVDNNDNGNGFWAVNQSGVQGIAAVLVPLDAVDEFSAQSLGGSEMGRNPAGTINVVIKSGSNHLHGSAYYFNRNEALAVQSPFAPPGSRKHELRNQNYGFALGGPVFKNRTFFFLTYEEQQYVIGNQARSSEPSQAYQTEAAALLANAGQKFGNYAPVPINPVSKNLLSTLWPADALTGAATASNYFNPNSSHGHSHNFLGKLDHSFNQNNRLSFRAFVGEGPQTAPTVSRISDYFEVAPSHMQNYALIFNTILTPRLTNQVLAGVNSFLQTYRDANLSFNPSASGLNTGVTSPDLSGAPNINIAGFDPVGITPFFGHNTPTGHITDTLSYAVGKHQLRFGGEYRRAQLDMFTNSAASRGVFNFTGAQGPWSPLLSNPNFDSNVVSLADFLAGYVYQSSIARGSGERLVHLNSFYLFAQDAWQVTRKLNLNLGLRYEYQGSIYDDKQDLSVFDPNRGGLVVVGTPGGVGSVYPASWTNFAPRIGFAYQPRENGSTVLRASYGIFFDAPTPGYFIYGLFPTSNNGPVGLGANPAGNNQVYTVQKNGYTIVPDQSIFPTGAASVSGSNVYNLTSVSRNFRTPYAQMYSLNMQQGLGSRWIFQVGYVGSAGRKLPIELDINQAALGSGFNNSTVIGPNGFPFTFQQASRPYFSQFPNFGVINEFRSVGTSNYNSLQTTLRSKAWHGLTAQFGYTWSHSLDEVSWGCCALVQDSTNVKGSYGNSTFDQPHRFTGVVTYQVPASSIGPQWLLYGWQLNSRIVINKGLPFSPYADADYSGTGENTERAVQIGDPWASVSHTLVNNSYVQWVNPSAFTEPSQGTWGTVHRNQFHNPSLADVDLSIFKDIPIKESLRAQFRIEMFNVFNRVNLAPVNPFLGPGFGQSSDTVGDYNGAPGIGLGEPFNVQLGLRLVF